MNLKAILTYTGALALGIFTVVLVRKIPRTSGRPPAFVNALVPEPYGMLLFHAAYWLHAILVVLLMPKPLKSIVFSNGGVIFLGTVFPVVESINAACTDVETDNTTWLQYWCMHGTFEYLTEFMDVLAEKHPRIFGNWFAFEFYVLLWMILPFTDGADVLYDFVTKPYIVPLLRPLKEKCEGWLATLALTVVNASHIWFFAGIFMTLPVLLKRATVMTAGTVYPVISSTVSLADGEVAKWLTYWSCFSTLLLIMVFAEKTIGPVPGLYTLCLGAVMYLMLPVFNGSEQVFRNILVPLFRQREALIVKDAGLLAKTLIKQLPADRHEAAHKAATEAFLKVVGESAGVAGAA